MFQLLSKNTPSLPQTCYSRCYGQTTNASTKPQQQ